MLIKPFPILETKQLNLIELTYEHIVDLFLMRSDIRMHEFTDTLPDLTHDDTRLYIDKMINGVNQSKWIIWAIEHKDTKKIIGTISIWNILNNSTELGYGIMPSYQGFGYMKEALGEVIEFGLTKLGLSYLDAYTEVSNLRSKSLLERLKFEYINEVIDTGYTNNRDYRMLCYRIYNKIEKENVNA